VHLNQYAFGALPFRAPTLLVAHSCVLSWWRAVHREPAPPRWDRYRDAVRRGLHGATDVAAPTRAMLAALAHEYRFGRSGRALPNARDPRRYAGADIDPARREPVVLAAGRLWDEAKNLAALERVAPRLAWPIVVAGPLRSPDAEAAGAAGADLDFAAQPRAVRALGELDADALADRYARAAIYALPARYEPFGLSVLEAALSGCPLVLGDIASLRETWRDAALFVAPDDDDALAAALERLIGDATLRAELAQRARRRALRYTPERAARAYLAAYARIAPRAFSTLTRFPEPVACAS